MGKLRRVFIAGAVICLLPLAAVILAALLAGLLGCELNEGVQQACYVFGLDLGGVLSGMFVMGWLALLTLPLLAGLLGLWALLEGGVFWRQRRHQRKGGAGQVPSPAPGEQA